MSKFVEVVRLAILEEQKSVISRIKRDPVIASVHSLLASQLDASLKYHTKEHSAM